MKKDLLKLNKKNENYKIEFETNINDSLKFFDTFMQFVSLKNNIKYNKVERNEYNSIKMARNKNELLNEFIELFTNTKEGKEIINEIKELYNEAFDSNVSDVDTRELLEKGKQQEMKLEEKKPKEVKTKEKKPKEVKQEVKIVEEEKPFQLLKKVKS